MVETAPVSAPAFSATSAAPDILARAFAEPCPLNTWEFARDHITLSSKASPMNPGPFDPDKSPHTKFFQELLDDPDVFQITVKKNSQGGFTQAVLNKIVKIVAVEPRNVLYVIDSLQEIKRIARDRLKPMLESCALSKATIDEDDDNELQTLTFFLRDMSIYFAGGGSIGAVANKAISFAVVDEADKIPRLTGGHTHIVEEVKARFKSIEAGETKLVVLSAPNEETDITTTEHNKGSCHKLFVPCPHCSHKQLMVPANVIYDHCRRDDGTYDLERVRRETYYRCEKMGAAENPCPDGRIYDHHKRPMVLAAEWRATNPNAEPGHISLESSDLFSIFEGAKLGLIALDLIEGERDPLVKKAKFSNRFGLEHKTQRAEIKDDEVRALRGDYERGTIPADFGRVVYVPLASDVQDDVFKWVRGAFNERGELAIVDYGANLEAGDLITQADRPVRDLRTGTDWVSSEGIIDEGFRTMAVRSFCVATGHRFFPAKGSHVTNTRGALVSQSITPHDGTEFPVYHFNDAEFKRSLYIERIREFKKIVDKKSKFPRLWLPRDCESEFISELRNEHLLPETSDWGVTVHRWKKVGTNDWGDAVKLLYVLWFIAGPEILAEIARQREAEEAAKTQLVKDRIAQAFPPR